MNAIEKLYTVIAQQFPNERITTNQAANAVGLTRGVTSSYLSKLAKQDYLLKTGTRPVYWQVKRAQSAFDHLIGSTGSLAPDIQRAIETIVYPEHGLPILITGPSGSGKGTLARTIYREALHRKILTQTAFFKTINCTNYKGQPENLKQALQSVITQATADNAQQSGYLYVKNFQALRPADQQHNSTCSHWPTNRLQLIFATFCQQQLPAWTPTRFILKVPFLKSVWFPSTTGPLTNGLRSWHNSCNNRLIKLPGPFVSHWPRSWLWQLSSTMIISEDCATTSK